ncbi:hypothetical protein APV28_4973 [Comamonas testosteroni]|nr:hypothetical protein APV28_4973 [Comamonas testosteroni]
MADPGSSVLVTWPDGTTSTATADPVTGAWSVDATVAQPSGTVTAMATDPAGNTSPAQTAAWTADTTAPDTTAAGTTVTVGAIAGDNIVNSTEASTATLPVTVTLANVPTDATTTTVNVLVDGVSYAATSNGDGTWTAQVPGSALAGATTPTVTAEATFTDAAGNTSAPVSDTQNYTVDTAAPTLVSAVTNTDGSNLVLTYNEPLDPANPPVAGDFVVNVNGSPVTVTSVTVSGNTVTLILTTPVAIGDTVTASYTDPTAGNDTAATQDLAGNDAATFTATPVTNGVLPPSPTVTITTDANNDAVLGATEVSGLTTATVTVGLSPTAAIGDVITLSDGINPPVQHTLDAIDISSGSWTTAVALPANGATLTVSATLTSGGLTSTAATDSAVLDLLDAVADAATLNTGNTTATVGPEVTTNNTGVLGLAQASTGTDGSQTVTIDDDYSVLHVEVSQQALVAVADGYRVDIVDATGKVIASTNPNDPNLVGQVLTPIIGGTLGVSGTNTLTVDFVGLPAGTYSVVVHNDQGQLSTLLDSDGSGGVSLQELGDNGVILGAENETLIVDTVVNALNNSILGINLNLGSTVKPLLTAALDLVNTAGQETPVSALVGILGDVLSGLPLLGLSVTQVVDSLVSTLATTLLTNTLTLLQTTTITTQLTEYAFVGTLPLEGNVINDADPAGNDTPGSVGATTVTEVTHTVNGVTTTVTVDPSTGADIVGSYGTLHINADGSYTYTANGNPAAPGHADVFTYTLADGARSDTATLTINLVDTAAPTQIPTITGITGEPTGDWTTTDTSPTILGTLSAPLLPGEKIQVQIDGGAWVDAYMDPKDTDGSNGWTWFYGSSDLTGGSHTVNVRVVDQSGNIGLNTDSQPIVIDTANRAPAAVVNEGLLGGLVGADLLGLVDLGNQTFVAYDPNNNLQSISVSYEVPLNVGAFALAASNQIAAELGLQFSVVNTSYSIDNNGTPLNPLDDTIIFPSSTLTITAIGGGPIDNLAVNELLRSVHLTADLSLSVTPTYSITTTDMSGLTTTDSATTLIDLGLFGSAGDPTVIQGTASDNTVTGTSADEHLYGFAGNDILRGGDGNDLLRGGAGVDQLYGDKGNDTLVYDAADTVIDGGDGTDTLLITSGVASITGGATAVHDIEVIQLGADTSAVTLTLDGDGAAHATGAGSQLFIHGNGSDTVNLTGGVYGGEALINNQAYAQYTLGGTTVLIDPAVAVHNSVTGTSGNDILHVNGAAASDTLTGNGGSDVFLWDSLNPANTTGGNGTDTITDFTIGVVGTSANADVLDLSQLLTGYTPDADGPAHYVGGVATIDAGDSIGQFLSVANVGGNTVISIDRDGAGTAYQSTPLVTLNGVTTDLATLLANHQVIV